MELSNDISQLRGWRVFFIPNCARAYISRLFLAGFGDSRPTVSRDFSSDTCFKSENSPENYWYITSRVQLQVQQITSIEFLREVKWLQNNLRLITNISINTCHNFCVTLNYNKLENLL